MYNFIYNLMLRGVDLIDIVGWEIFLYFSHLYIIRAIMYSGDTGGVDFFWETAKLPPHAFIFPLPQAKH